MLGRLSFTCGAPAHFSEGMQKALSFAYNARKPLAWFDDAPRLSSTKL